MRRICRDAAGDGLLPHGYKLGRPNTWTEVWPFLAAGIPGINVSTFTDGFDRTEYHTQHDTADGVDFDYLAKLTEVCARMLLDEHRLDFRARFHQRFELCRVDVVHDQRKSVLRQVERHRSTHGAEADKPHFAGHAAAPVAVPA